MLEPNEFLMWLKSLPQTNVPLHGNPGRTIELMALAKDLHQHHDFLSWWKGKNMPRHLNNTVAKTILEQNPPENVRAAMLFMMM